MIKSFRDADTRGLKVKNTARLQRILDALDRARRPDALNLPGLNFHQLKGNRAGTYSVWISGNWRLTFGWDKDAPVDVALEDYH